MKLIEKMAIVFSTAGYGPESSPYARQGYLAGFRAAREMCAQECGKRVVVMESESHSVGPTTSATMSFAQVGRSRLPHEIEAAIRQLGEAEEGNPT